mgnify:CR=1 FL=1
MKNIYLKKAFCSALAAGVAIAGLNAPVQTDAKTTTKKSIDNMSVMSRVVSKNNDGLLRYSYVDENGKKIDFDGSSACGNNINRILSHHHMILENTDRQPLSKTRVLQEAAGLLPP